MENKVSILNDHIRILTVKWREHDIGYLMREVGVGYLYKYNSEGMKKAREDGFPYLIGFKDLRKVYASSDLFPVFKSRIPTKQRRNLHEILLNLGIDSYDEFDYLVATGGRLYTDDITVAEDQIIKASIENRKRIAAYRNATQHIVISKKDKREDKKVDRTRDE